MALNLFYISFAISRRDSEDEVVADADGGSLYHSLASRVIKFASAMSFTWNLVPLHVTKKNPEEEKATTCKRSYQTRRHSCILHRHI